MINKTAYIVNIDTKCEFKKRILHLQNRKMEYNTTSNVIYINRILQ